MQVWYLFISIEKRRRLDQGAHKMRKGVFVCYVRYTKMNDFDSWLKNSKKVN